MRTENETKIKNLKNSENQVRTHELRLKLKIVLSVLTKIYKRPFFGEEF